MTIRCYLCWETVASVQESLDLGWHLEFTVDGKHYDSPICPRCVLTYRWLDEHGVHVPLTNGEANQFEAAMAELIASGKMRRVFDPVHGEAFVFPPSEPG